MKNRPENPQRPCAAVKQNCQCKLTDGHSYGTGRLTDHVCVDCESVWNEFGWLILSPRRCGT
jgi:hypothetical protein